jgi:hypothetical protein
VIFSGIFDFRWWGCALAAFVLTDVTIVAVTVFLHRHQAHRALEYGVSESYLGTKIGSPFLRHHPRCQPEPQPKEAAYGRMSASETP